MHSYQILTDATADLPPELVEQLELTVIPMEFQVQGNDYIFEPTEQNLKTSAFYALLRDGQVATTSQINMFTYLHHFEDVLKRGEDVLYIAFSSGLSGSLQVSRLAVEELLAKYPERKILCVDSLSASLGEGLLVYAAAKKRQEGLDLEALANWVAENRLHLCHWFTVDDLNHLRRGGRVSSAAAAFGTALKIKPVLHVDDEGHLIPISKVQGRKRSLKSLVDEMEKTYWPDQNDIVFIGHGDCEADAHYVRDCVRERFQIDAFVVHTIGPIIGAHSGPGTVALFFFGDHR